MVIGDNCLNNSDSVTGLSDEDCRVDRLRAGGRFAAKPSTKGQGGLTGMLFYS